MKGRRYASFTSIPVMTTTGTSGTRLPIRMRLEQVLAAHVGQEQIEDDEPRRLEGFVDGFERVAPVPEAPDAVSTRPEGLGEHVADLRLVVHEANPSQDGRERTRRSLTRT